MRGSSGCLVAVVVAALAAGCGDYADKAQLAQALERIAKLEARTTADAGERAKSEERIEKLETQLAVLAKPSGDVAHYKRVVVEKLEVVDGAGRVRADISANGKGGAVRLELNDDAQVLRALLDQACFSG